MKKLIGLIAIFASMALLALPASANGILTQPDEVTQDQCTPEKKLAWYNEFRAVLKTDQAKAYELAKKWLACPEVAGEEQITPYLKNFVAKWEKASRQGQVTDLVYNKKDYAKAFEVGKALLADEPENLKVMIDLAYAGFAAAAAKNEAFLADAITYAKKAMQLIEAGKAPDDWTPYTGGRDEALAYLNNIIGQLTVQSNPSEALPYLIKVAPYESKLKKAPITYASIAAAYEAGPYAKMASDYEREFKGKDETPESKLALENINQVIDRMIDAYARAVALAANDPAQQAAKKVWMDSLSTWYKYRHNQSDAGLTEVIASVLSKPLPPPPTPITTLPTPAPVSSPASGSANSPGSTPPSTVATGPVPANKQAPASTTTAPAPSGTPAKPAAPGKTTSTPPKPKIRRNHKGH